MAQNGLLSILADAYQRNIGQPFAQIAGNGVRGLLGLDPADYADGLGMEAYRNAQALSNTPGVNAPAGSFKAAARVAPEMAGLLPGALVSARGLLEEVAKGGKPKAIDIAELTPPQFSEINSARRGYGQPEFTAPTVVYNGRHHYKSRNADGDSIDEMLLQLANSLDDTSVVVMAPRGPALQNPQSRINPRGETVQDRAVLEGGGDRPTWLYSAIPKKKAP